MWPHRQAEADSLGTAVPRGSAGAPSSRTGRSLPSADWADRVMGVAVTDRFHAKAGANTIARWSLGTGEQSLVVYLKRHYRLPWWHGLLALLWPEANWSPALQEWEHLEWARRKGLPVPEAVAGAEFIGPWGRFQSFIAVAELTGMVALHEALPLAAARLDPVTFRCWKDGLIREMAAIALDLHRRRAGSTRICTSATFTWPMRPIARPPDDWRGRVQLIDLHRLARHRWTWLWRRTKDLAQLLYSSDVPGVTAHDRLRFWKTYLAADPLGWLHTGGPLVRRRAGVELPPPQSPQTIETPTSRIETGEPARFTSPCLAHSRSLYASPQSRPQGHPYGNVPFRSCGLDG